MHFIFQKDITAPYGFVAYPSCLKVKSIEAKMHLDTPYVRMVIETKERYLNYLFDKDRNHIPWEQRKEEIKDLPTEIKTYDDGFRVERSREIMTGEGDALLDGREHIVDRVYKKEHFLGNKREIELAPIDDVCEEVRNIQYSKKRFANKREENEIAYLDPFTPKEKRLEILYEEVSSLVAMYAYHFMVRDADKLASLPEYEEYLKLYFSHVPNKEENYIDYLKAYCAAVEENVVDEIEDKDAFVREYCHKAGLSYKKAKHDQTK